MTRRLEVHAASIPSHAAARALGERGPQVRVLVAATSRAAAGRALRDVGLLAGGSEATASRYLAEWGNVTGNAAEVALATAEPGTVYVLPLNSRDVDGALKWTGVQA